MYDIKNTYAENVLTLNKLKKLLDINDYNNLVKVIDGTTELNKELGNSVAKCMLTWALEKGATHYCHWFQPLTGKTAEKHNSFITPIGDFTIELEFSRKDLLKGESDASSFPTLGLRETFEARGYTTWDTTSFAFIKERGNQKVLYIPTVFLGFNGEVLDMKYPLIKSTKELEKSVLKVLKALGDDSCNKIKINIGPEQEYFLVSKDAYDNRPDLQLTGRTVFGTLPTKGQELNDHYYGTISEKVLSFMDELNKELWKTGISSKTQHKEVAFNQFEIAVVYDDVNISNDQNQIVMDTISDIALRHNMVALLHEKPFNGINGSGKHNNWSITTDTNINLLKPGKTTSENLRFLLFLTSIIAAVDQYPTLFKLASSCRSNDLRLGGFEAPPSIISIYLGNVISEALDTVVETGDIKLYEKELIKLGVSSLPTLSKSIIDRNRTSPLAFTGNKFEIRTIGSSQSVSDVNIYLNSAVSKVLDDIAIKLEQGSTPTQIIKELYTQHKKVVYNGNGYDKKWITEASKRGLLNLANTVDAITYSNNKENLELLVSKGIFSEKEFVSRTNIMYQDYSKKVNIEASIMLKMCRSGIIPAVLKQINSYSKTILKQQQLGLKIIAQEKILKTLNTNLNQVIKLCYEIEDNLVSTRRIENNKERCDYYVRLILPKLSDLRTKVDGLETYVDKDLWPYPSYDKLLFTL